MLDTPSLLLASLPLFHIFCLLIFLAASWEVPPDLCSVSLILSSAVHCMEVKVSTCIFSFVRVIFVFFLQMCRVIYIFKYLVLLFLSSSSSYHFYCLPTSDIQASEVLSIEIFGIWIDSHLVTVCFLGFCRLFMVSLYLIAFHPQES